MEYQAVLCSIRGYYGLLGVLWTIMDYQGVLGTISSIKDYGLLESIWTILDYQEYQGVSGSIKYYMGLLAALGNIRTLRGLGTNQGVLGLL